MPLSKELISLAAERGMQLLLQVGGCFSAASLTEMFTGVMPSDLLKEGLGYLSLERYRDEQTKKIHVPWQAKTIQAALSKEGWKMHLHNVVPDSYLLGDIYTDSYKGGYEKRYQRVKDQHTSSYARNMMDDLLLKDDVAARAWQNRELNWIQEHHGTSHTFYLIEHLHYHSRGSVLRRGEQVNEDLLRKKTLDLIKAWDLEEPDTIFWFFSDHGEQRASNVIPKADSWLSWVLFKDNTFLDLKATSKLIAIRDFVPTILKILDYPYLKDPESKPIDELTDQGRIFFVEDGRKRFDEYHSTTALACSPIRWRSGIPTRILQTCYFTVNQRFYHHLNLLDVQGFYQRSFSSCSVELKRILQERFEWVPR